MGDIVHEGCSACIVLDAWCCVVLRGAAWCCVVLGAVWCCVVLCGVAWCCVLLRVLYWMYYASVYTPISWVLCRRR